MPTSPVRYSLFRKARALSTLHARRFCRNRRGAAAVEFAMIAPLFFMVLFAIIESALYFFAAEVLESATQKTARLVLTGQAQSSGLTASTFKTTLCANIPALFTCSGIVVDIRTVSAFTAANTGKMLDGSGNIDSAGAGYSPGVSGDIVVVRVAYAWPVLIRTLGFNMSDMSNGNRLIQASTAFRNE